MPDAAQLVVASMGLLLLQVYEGLGLLGRWKEAVSPLLDRFRHARTGEQKCVRWCFPAPITSIDYSTGLLCRYADKNYNVKIRKDEIERVFRGIVHSSDERGDREGWHQE